MQSQHHLRYCRNAVYVCLFIWILSVAMTGPFWFYSSISKPTQCSPSSTPSPLPKIPVVPQCEVSWPNDFPLKQSWVYLELSFGFILPILVMTVSYSLVIKQILYPRTPINGCNATAASAEGQSSAYSPDDNGSDASRFYRRNKSAQIKERLNSVPQRADSTTNNECVLVPDRTDTQISNCDDVSESGRKVIGDACVSLISRDKQTPRERTRPRRIQRTIQYGSNNTRRVTAMLLMVTVIFIVCWTPYHGNFLFTAHNICNKNNNYYNKNYTNNQTNSKICSHGTTLTNVAYGNSTFAEREKDLLPYMALTVIIQVLPFIASCCNPFIYYITSSNFRKYRLHILYQTLNYTSFNSNFESIFTALFNILSMIYKNQQNKRTSR